MPHHRRAGILSIASLALVVAGVGTAHAADPSAPASAPPAAGLPVAPPDVDDIELDFVRTPERWEVDIDTLRGVVQFHTEYTVVGFVP